MFMTAQEALRMTKEYEVGCIYNAISEAINRGQTTAIIGNGQDAFKFMNEKVATSLREKGYDVKFNEHIYPQPIISTSGFLADSVATSTGTMYIIKEWVISWADISSSL